MLSLRQRLNPYIFHKIRVPEHPFNRTACSADIQKTGLQPVSLQRNLKQRTKETNMSALKLKTFIHDYFDNNGYYVYYTNLHIFLAVATFHRNT